MPAMLRRLVRALAIPLCLSAGLGCRDTADMAAASAPPASLMSDLPAPGVPSTLAEERARRVSDLRYALHFTVPDAVNAAIGGAVTIHFTLADASRPLALDFAGRPDSVRGV